MRFHTRTVIDPYAGASITEAANAAKDHQNRYGGDMFLTFNDFTTRITDSTTVQDILHKYDKHCKDTSILYKLKELFRMLQESPKE